MPTTLINAVSVFRHADGRPIKVGYCCVCGRYLSQWRANKTGVRCVYEGAQYDRNGNLIHNGVLLAG